MTEKTLFDHDLTLEEAEELIKNGADVNINDHYGRTPLFFVKDINIAKLLIKHGADVNTEDAEGETAIFCVKQLDIAKLLIESNADLTIKNDINNTALFSVHNTQIAELLIQHGMDVNAKNDHGVTPIYYAADIDLIDFYINNGADVNFKTEDNYIPLYHHTKFLNKDIVTLLINAGSNLNIKSKHGGSILSIINDYNDVDPKIHQLLIEHGAVASEIKIYHIYRELFNPEQQKAFDAFASITNNDDDFFAMCLSYQEGVKNNIEIEIKEMEIL